MTESEDLRRQFAPLASRTPADRGACPSPEALASAAEKRETTEARLLILEHLATCATCRAEFDLLRTVAATDRAPRPIHRWLLAALPLAAAAVLVLILWPSRGPVPPVYRNAGSELLLHDPQPDTLGVRFSWQPVAGADHYTVEIFTLAGDSVGLFVSRDTSMLVPRPLGAPDSVLRWMVRAYLTDGRVSESAPARVPHTR